MNKEVIAGIILFTLIFVVPFLLDKNNSQPTTSSYEQLELDRAGGEPCYTNGHPLWNDC
jgi:hypothetical protein